MPSTDAAPTPKARPRRAKGPSKARRARAEARRWHICAGLLLLTVFALREALLLLPLIPVHFDEAQYWAYGEELALGHYSKPPLVGWVIRASTELFGDTLFGLRAAAPLMHLLIGALIHLTAARLFDARTGFWAAVLYTAAPGVTVSSLLITTDPVMMAGWALALYAVVRALDRPAKAPEPWHWWLLAGVGAGLGLLAKYTAVALPLGLLGHALLTRSEPVTKSRRDGALLAAGAALLVLSPNLAWNAANGFVTVTHLAENADTGAGVAPDPTDLLEFILAQLGVIGPVAFPAILVAAWAAGRAGDWRTRILFWTTAPLLLAMSVQALIAGANANWAAPAYVGGSILAAHWLLARGWRTALAAQAAVGVLALVLILGLGGLYARNAADLPRLYDPFKKMRIGGPFCELALTAMEAEGADALLSNDRRRLSECVFQGALPLSEIAVYEPDPAPNNHFEFRARLAPGDDRLLLLAVESPEAAERIAERFESAIPLGTGAFRTHADRETGYALWLVEGFRGYR